MYLVIIVYIELSIFNSLNCHETPHAPHWYKHSQFGVIHNVITHSMHIT